MPLSIRGEVSVSFLHLVMHRDNLGPSGGRPFLRKSSDPLNEIGEMLALVLEHMATKDDVRAIVRAEVPDIMREETEAIRDELTSIRRDLGCLGVNVTNLIGYRKESDHAFERIAAIEKHLGINKKIAA